VSQSTNEKQKKKHVVVKMPSGQKQKGRRAKKKKQHRKTREVVELGKEQQPAVGGSAANGILRRATITVGRGGESKHKSPGRTKAGMRGSRWTAPSAAVAAKNEGIKRSSWQAGRTTKTRKKDGVVKKAGVSTRPVDH